jgi:uncharacterized protein YbdZ (MbtH family)/acyl carrier protein
MLSLGPRTVSKLGKIRTVRVAGSELTPDILKSFRELMPQAKIQNGYSSTEIGTVAALWEAQEESTVPVEISIGRPVANTHIYVLDRHRNRVPVGTAGDIYVGARHLARGYLNRPDLTADRFVPDPFSIEPGSRMYFTGDLGRFQSNGNLQFMGRADDQVKIRGFRIELAEVEQALASHAGVREAAAAAKTIGGDQRLIAYVVVNEMGAPSPNQMRNHLRKSLPDHMIPSAFVFMDRLPLGGNGKVDRRLLPLPAPVRPKLDSEYVEPRDELELAVARVWSDLLGLAPIGVHDDFRELGGDSLLAAQVASRIGDLSGLEMDQESLFERPTIAELADYIRSHSGTAEPRRNSVGDAARASASGFVPQKEEFQTGAERTVIPDAFKVVVNLEEQYSLLPATLPVPQGWREAAIYGTKRDCLDAIARIWKDLRPLSVRRHLQSGGWSVT